MKILRELRKALSRAVLMGVWIGVITPVALLSRIVRGDVLQRRFEPEASTYWRTPEAHDSDGLFDFFRRNGKLWLLPVVLLLASLGVVLVASEGTLVFAFLYPLF